MPANGFTLSRVLYIVLSALIALIGLFAVSRAGDIGFALFGYGLIFFGYAFGFWMLKRGLDSREKVAG
jgi:Na+/phosphate symporter